MTYNIWSNSTHTLAFDLTFPPAGDTTTTEYWTRSYAQQCVELDGIPGPEMHSGTLDGEVGIGSNCLVATLNPVTGSPGTGFHGVPAIMLGESLALAESLGAPELIEADVLTPSGGLVPCNNVAQMSAGSVSAEDD